MYLSQLSWNRWEYKAYFSSLFCIHVCLIVLQLSNGWDLWTWSLLTTDHLQTTVCTHLKATSCYCRYKAVERLAAEEFERERPRVPTRGRTEITLCLSPSPANHSLSRCTTPSPIILQENTITTAHKTSGKHCPPVIYSSLGPER